MAYEDRIMRIAAAKRQQESADTNKKRGFFSDLTGMGKDIRGIMNPHIREKRLRSLRTPSEQTIGPVGRGPLSVAEAAYHRGNVQKPYNINVPLPYSPPGQTIGPAGRKPLTRSEMIANQAIAEREEEEEKYQDWYDNPWGKMPNTGMFLGDTGQVLEPSYEMGTGIVYDAPHGGTTYNSILDMAYGKDTFPGWEGTPRPVQKHQFPSTGFKGGRFGTPEEVENIDPVLGGDWMSKIGGALKNEFGGSAMAGELMDMRDLRGQEKFSAEELRNLGLSGDDEGALADEDHRMGIEPPNYPRWQNLWGALPWNRGGIASLRRYR